MTDLFNLFSPFLPFLSFLIPVIFNYYVIIKKRLSWQTVLIANIVFLSVMSLIDIPVYDFIGEINIIEGIGDIIAVIWELIKGIFT